MFKYAFYDAYGFGWYCLWKQRTKDRSWSRLLPIVFSKIEEHWVQNGSHVLQGFQYHDPKDIIVLPKNHIRMCLHYMHCMLVFKNKTVTNKTIVHAISDAK